MFVWDKYIYIQGPKAQIRVDVHDTRPLRIHTSSGMCWSCQWPLFSFIRSTLHFTRYVNFVSPFWARSFLPPEPLSPSDPPYSSSTLVVQSRVRVENPHTRALLLCCDLIVSNTLQIRLALVVLSSASAWPLYHVHQPRLLEDRGSWPPPL